MNSDLKRNLALPRKGNVIPGKKNLFESASPLELGEGAICIVVDIIAVGEMRHLPFVAHLNSLRDQRIGRALVEVLHHAQDLDDIRRSIGKGTSEVADHLALVISLKECGSIRVSRVLLANRFGIFVVMPKCLTLTHRSFVIDIDNDLDKRVVQRGHFDLYAALCSLADGSPHA